MAIENFRLKWTHAICRVNPSFLSDKLICCPSDFTMKISDVDARHVRSTDQPGVHIGCVTCTPELGVIAVSERSEHSIIYILRYPELNTISKLQCDSSKTYLALRFTGIEFLISVSVKMDYEIDLWRWSTGQLLFRATDLLTPSEIPEVALLVNPMIWHELCLQSNTRLRLMEIKGSDDKYSLKVRRLFFQEKENGSFLVLSKDTQPSDAGKYEGHSAFLSIVSHCWFPKDFILVETSSGLLKVNPYLHRADVLNREPESKAMITSMVVSRRGLFVGYKTGFVDVVNISRDRWIILETIKIGQPVRNLILSPHYDTLVITTLKGSVFLQKEDSQELNEVLREDTAGEVGLCTIGPMSQHCLIARKTGVLNVFKMSTGVLVSGIQLEEDITSIASSPLCSLVLIGSNSGFLHFLDVTDPKHPKVVHCVGPYEAPVEFIKFENYGRLIVTSAGGHFVNIWNGLPSSGFEFLGSLKFTESVKDIALFSSREKGEASLLILSEGGASSEKEAGNMLTLLNMPANFISRSQKYHTDVFRSLNAENLYSHKWRLNYPCVKMDVHGTLGALFYSPILGKVQKFPVWDEYSHKQINLSNSKDVAFLRISSNEQWIGTIDVHGYVQIYSADNFKVVATIPKSAASDLSCRQFLDFSVLGDSLVFGSESGYIMCYHWTNVLNNNKIIPEWLAYCQHHADQENDNLQRMDEEEPVNLKMSKTLLKPESSLAYEEHLEKLRKHVNVLNFEIHRLSGIYEIENETDLEGVDFAFDEGILQSLSDNNFQNFVALASTIGGSHFFEESPIENQIADEPKEIHSTNLGFTVQNYFATQEASVIKDVQDWSTTKRAVTSDVDLNLFDKGGNLKSEEERFTLIQELRTIIRKWKTDFNDCFNKLYVEKDSVDDRISDIRFEMERTSSELPSEAEKDLWRALFERNDFDLREDPDSSQKLSSEEFKVDSAEARCVSSTRKKVQNIKSSIENLRAVSQEVKKGFDADLQRLSLKKFYCNHIIHFLELKIFGVLLFTSVEEKSAQCRKKTEEELRSLQGFGKDLELLSDKLKVQEENIRLLYSKIQRMERSVDCKIEGKCNKLPGDIRESAYFKLREVSARNLRCDSNNPFWSPSSKITPEILSCTDSACPGGINRTFWNKVVTKRSRYVKLGIILNHVEFQAILLTSFRLKCADMRMKLESRLLSCKRIIDDVEVLLANLNISLHKLMAEELENPINDAVFRIGEIHSLNLKQIPRMGDEIWKCIKMSAMRNRRLQLNLERTGKMLKIFWDLQEKVHCKHSKYQRKLSSRMQELQEDLEIKSEDFSSSKVLIDGKLQKFSSTDDKKWNISKLTF